MFEHALAKLKRKQFHSLLSIRENDFIAHTEHSNFDSFYMDIQAHAEPNRETIATLAEHTLKRFHRLLLSNSIQGSNIITGLKHMWKRFHSWLSILRNV